MAFPLCCNAWLTFCELCVLSTSRRRKLLSRSSKAILCLPWDLIGWSVPWLLWASLAWAASRPLRVWCQCCTAPPFLARKPQLVWNRLCVWDQPAFPSHERRNVQIFSFFFQHIFYFFIFCNYSTWNIVTAIGYFTALMVNAKQPSNNTARNLICKAVFRFVHSIRKSDSFVWGTIVRFSDGVYTTFDSRFRANIYKVFLVMELNDFHVMCIVFGSEKSETKDCAWSEKKKKKKSLCRARIFKRYFLSSVPTCCERKKIGRLFGWYPYSVYPTFYSGLVNNL